MPRSNYEYYTDPLYKLKISEAIKNYLYNNSKKKKEELSELIDYNIRVVDSLPLITERIKNAHESLYLVSLKAVNRLDGISQKKEFCINFGEQIEKRFKKFYNNKGYTTDPEKPRNIRKYLRSEFEFFTRILNELYQKLD
ncbi:MAG: hypothetical protein KatS3mg002_0891 [Candidatus Woesearchaeota archaeon]|nr:MAG: hypothetical protein KatS3mg002_0891 [Candidatus Woesearchaeota archaeon]